MLGLTKTIRGGEEALQFSNHVICYMVSSVVMKKINGGGILVTLELF